MDFLRPLAEASARMGKDPLLIQGAGGNTSCKRDGVLWVKASGKWLAAAEEESMFVPVDLDGVRRRIVGGDVDPVSPEVIGAPAGGLRPSIETTLHALMPHRVVVHVHSVNTIAWASRTDGEQAVRPLMEGLAWAWVPYRRPGLPLTQSVSQLLGQRPVDVLVLATHGLVLGAGSCDEARRLLDAVERKVAVEARLAPAADLHRLRSLADGTGYRLPKRAEGHAVATDPVSLKFAVNGSLYPDHVVFLGPAVTAVADGDSVAETLARAVAQGGMEPPILLIPGVGTLVRESLSAGAEEMLLCLALVLARIPADASVAYLSDDETAALLDWDAEKYRQQLAHGV